MSSKTSNRRQRHPHICCAVLCRMMQFATCSQLRPRASTVSAHCSHSAPCSFCWQCSPMVSIKRVHVNAAKSQKPRAA
jgi:hypothetical protein